MKTIFLVLLMSITIYAQLPTSNDYLAEQEALSKQMVPSLAEQKKHEGYTINDIYKNKNSEIWREKGTNKLANGFVHETMSNGYSKEFTLKKGKIEGKYIMYSDRGLCSVEHYVDGLKNGKTLIYSDSVPYQIIIKENYLNGLQEGKSYGYYDKSGKLSSIEKYKNGKKDGVQKYFYNSANLWEVVVYNKGIILSDTLFYETGEKMRSEKFFKSNEIKGEVFYKSENIKSQYSGYEKNVGDKKNVNVKINTYYKNGHKEYEIFIKGEDNFTGYKFNNDKKIKMNYAQTYNYIRTKEWLKGEK